MVPPDGLRFHIHDAVNQAGAERIGHGVGVPRAGGAERQRRVFNENRDVVDVVRQIIAIRNGEDVTVRREEVERLRANEERQRQRALLSRYPDANALERDRAGVGRDQGRQNELQHIDRFSFVGA